MLRPFEVRRLQEDLPGYRPLPPFEAALPLHHLVLSVRVLAEKGLTAVEEFVLRAVGLGLADPAQIEAALGLPEASVRVTLSSLLASDLVCPLKSEPSSPGFTTTSLGTDALAKAAIVVPELVTFHIIFDALTGTLAPSYREMFIAPGQARSEGRHIVPGRHGAPHLNELERGAVARAIRDFRHAQPGRAPKGQLLDLISVDKVFTQYRRCDVVVFDSPDQTHLVFRILDRGVRQPDHESVLAVEFRSRPEILPFEAARATESDQLAIAPVPQEWLREIDEREDQLVRLLQEARSSESGVGDVAQPEPEVETVQVAEAPPAASQELLTRITSLEKQLESLKYVQASEHRTYLLKALRHARQRVIVVSPWLSPAAVNHELLDLIKKALKRGVNIVFGWGIAPDDVKQPNQRDVENHKYVLRQLQHLAAEKNTGTLRVVRLGDTHQKILIADIRFAIVSSFNFLSFRGDPNRALRQETGVYIEYPKKVQELADTVMVRIEVAEAAAATYTSR